MLVGPLFPLQEEKKNKVKKKEEAKTSRREKEEFQKIGLPDPLPDVRRQIGQEKVKIGVSNLVGEKGENGLSIVGGKPLPYRPPSLARK